ncbi:MAG: carbohydrate ABC transporter permease, partial [Cellulosilyticaceae bacterium]
NAIDWMKTDWAFWVLVASYIWRNIGYNMVLWLAGLSNISPTVYEAARVDGANAWQQFAKITIPQLLPTLFTIVVLSLLNSFKVFREAYLVAGDYPHDSMYMLQHLFNNWFTSLDIDKLSAAATLMAAVIFILILLLQKAWESED